MLFQKAGIDWIVVCLGNPGTKYNGTRHNAGFLVADKLADKKNFRIDRLRFRALTGRCEINGESVLVMKPQTFMNLSGESVIQAVSFFKVKSDRILVVSDEIALPPGTIRIRTKGSAGGHNGLKNIIAHLHTEEFPRIRVGVGAPAHSGNEQIDWVLSVPKNEDAVLYAQGIEKAADAIVDYIENGPSHAMTKFN